MRRHTERHLVDRIGWLRASVLGANDGINLYRKPDRRRGVGCDAVQWGAADRHCRPGCWHLSNRLIVPSNIALVALPPKCLELNPVENVWQFTRQLALKPRLHLLREPPRPLLRRLEQAP